MRVDMTVQRRSVTVMQLPERFSDKDVRTFFREIERYMDLGRPYLVLDCSNLRQLDKRVAHLLLRCLEEAMKRNGDVKLGGIPPSADLILGLSGINRLFETFDTTADAVNSFHQLPVEAFAESDESESAA
jgi:anti-anti-sigma regulatory factor